MTLVGWSKAFEDHKTFGDIPARVRKVEIIYWIGILFSLGLTALGIVVMLSAPSGALKQMVLGLFLALDGAISWAVIKVWVHVRLAMYWVIWDAQKRQNKETQVA